jgi:putative transposase
MGEMGTMTVRYSYRLRTSPGSERELLAEWDRDRWVWNQCVATSRAAHLAQQECGPARLDKLLTGWRAEHEWLREGSSVAQQQTVRDFGAARAKALADRKAKLPVRQRRGMPRFQRKNEALPSLNYTLRGFSLKEGRRCLANGIGLTVVWSRELPCAPSSVRVYRDATGKWWASFVARVPVEPLAPTARVIGIDWGVTETATTTDPGFELPHAQHGKKAAAALAHYSARWPVGALGRARRPQPGTVGPRPMRPRTTTTWPN